MRVLTIFMAMMSCAILRAQESKPGSVVWQGKVAIGTELDDRGIPVEEKKDAAKPSRIRVGFSASWSFAVHWEQPPTEKERETNENVDLTDDEAKVIELTNAERKKLKLPELKPDPVLMKVARDQSATMARLDRVGHDLEERPFSKRMDQAKYQASRAGENIASGQQNSTEAVDDWMKSPGHKANIVQPDYSRTGVGFAKSKSGKTYWTQVFAKPD